MTGVSNFVNATGGTATVGFSSDDVLLLWPQYGMPTSTWHVHAYVGVVLLWIGHGLYKVQAVMSIDVGDGKPREPLDLSPAFVTIDKTLGQLLACQVVTELTDNLDIDRPLVMESILQKLAERVSTTKVGECFLIDRESMVKQEHEE